MTKLSGSKSLTVFTAVALSAVLSLNLASAQPKPNKKAAAGGDAPAKVKGRLPPYYKDIVEAKQRDEIYRVQADYNSKIADLEEQIATLTAERDAAVENVLTAEQKDKLKKAREQASSKKKKSTDTAKVEESAPGE